MLPLVFHKTANVVLMNDVTIAVTVPVRSHHNEFMVHSYLTNSFIGQAHGEAGVQHVVREWIRNIGQLSQGLPSRDFM